MKSKTPTEAYYKQETERLSFRPLVVSDIELWTAFYNDNPSERFVGGDKLGSTPVEKATTWIMKQIERQRNNEFGQLAVIEKESGSLIGLGGIIYRDMDDAEEFEVTYSLLPTCWGKGYATELAVHFKNFAFKYIDSPSVISMIHKENEPSMNVARKNGMVLSSETSFLDMPINVFRVEVPEEYQIT